MDYLQYKNRQVLLLQVLTPEELDPSYSGNVNLMDAEATDPFDSRNMRLKITSGMLAAYDEALRDFLADMKEQLKTSPEALWKINIFGKTVEQMVEEGLISKSNKINDDSQIRLQDTMEKIINDSNGGMVFIII